MSLQTISRRQAAVRMSLTIQTSHFEMTKPKPPGTPHGNRIHGLCRTPVYKSWGLMIQRCTNPKNPHFKDYGARGINVCKRWRTFTNFFSDMGYPPAGHSIERQNVNGDYCPSNCIWLPKNQQSWNRRMSTRFEYQGKTYVVAEVAHKHGVKLSTAQARIIRLGWEPWKAATTPPK